eukprot:9104239-Pyramimonas_sp.AAC.1
MCQTMRPQNPKLKCIRDPTQQHAFEEKHHQNVTAAGIPHPAGVQCQRVEQQAELLGLAREDG